MSAADLWCRRTVFHAAAAAWMACFGVTACGGTSSQTFTAPSVLSKCAVTLEASDSTVSAAGGTGHITVKTHRECQWSASSDAGWLSLMAGGSGQGDGTIQYRAAANPDPVARTGAIVANEERAAITQQAGECRIELAHSSASFPPAGGSGSVQVGASSALCTWAVSIDAQWVTLRSAPEGQGSATVAFDVAPTTGPPRTATMTIAGQPFAIIQAEGCTFSIAPETHAAGAAGGSGTIAVTTEAGCPWTASSTVPWIIVAQGASGSGSGLVAFTVEPTGGPERTGSMVAAGRTFTVTQAAGCRYEVAPATHAVDAAGGTRSVSVAAPDGCSWSASSNVPWITLTSASAGHGTGEVTFSVAPASGPARNGTVTVAGQTVTVTQAQGCTYAISPETESMPPDGGRGTIEVSTGTGCEWTASSQASWITVTSGSSGSGEGQVEYTVAASSGPARSGTITAAGRTFTIEQAGGCSFTVAPDTLAASAAGEDATISVNAASGCSWNAESHAGWIAIVSGASGAGDGQVRLSIAANTGGARSGTVTVAGRTVTVMQGDGCSIALSPSEQSVPADGGAGSFTVATGDACPWTARASAGWISITAGDGGSGSDAVQFSVQPNTGAARAGTIDVSGQTFTVNQAGGCSFTVAPETLAATAAGEDATISVNADPSCSWNAESHAGWIAIVSGASGTGDGQVRLSIAANTGGARSGTVTVAGRTVTVMQDGGCSFTVAPDTLAASAAGEDATISVNTAPGCSWNAESHAGWIAIVSGASGTGGGQVRLEVQANGGAARSATVTVAGRSVIVNQESGCTFSVSPETAEVSAEGGAGTIAVTAGPGCDWTAASDVPWIAVTSGSGGTGNGEVAFTVDRNDDDDPRTGTITIAGRTVTVRQRGEL